MKEEQIQRIVIEVIRRLAVRLGADGSRGTLIVVFTGATVAFKEAIQQVRFIILGGYRVQLVFSQAAEDLYGQVVREQLEGFPHITMLDPARWFTALKESKAIVVPLLSINTVSKVALLIADNVPTNLILHALFMGKPVFAARNSADPEGGHWQKSLGSRTQRPALRQEFLKRLQCVENYGCRLTDTLELERAVSVSLAKEKASNVEQSDDNVRSARSMFEHSGNILTAADVCYAHRLGADLSFPHATLITPLARDLAMRYGMALLRSEKS